jgi:Protein of unknown function (DUF3810)
MLWRLAVAAGAVAGALAPIPPAPVERYYSNGLYPAVQRLVTGWSNTVPLALLDALLVAVPIWLIWRTMRDWGAGSAPLPATFRTVARVGTVAAILYLLFLAVWGLNYRRLPLKDKIAFDGTAVTPPAVVALAKRSAMEANDAHGPAHNAGWSTPVDGHGSLQRGFDRAASSLGVKWPVRTARPKSTLLDFYFRSAGVAGMTDPFFLETLVATDLLPFERPFVVAHEWSHLAGFNDEGEANFLGWLAAIGGNEQARYSAWLFMYGQTAGSLGESDRKAVADLLEEGPRADLRAIAARVARNVNPAVAQAGWRAYDQYLKANRVDAGIASYSTVVELVLGTRRVETPMP